MHKFCKTYNVNQTLYPNLFSILKSLPDKWIFSDKHNPVLKHPGAILNRAANEIVQSFSKVLKALKMISITDGSNDMIDGTNNLLGEMTNLFGHFDSFQIGRASC